MVLQQHRRCVHPFTVGPLLSVLASNSSSDSGSSKSKTVAAAAAAAAVVMARLFSVTTAAPSIVERGANGEGGQWV
jgi:hypothetical protein